jgi:anaerobic magnesium-protoporphyrin IX monomethyl ester cyclase
MKILLVAGNKERQGFTPLGPLYLAAYLAKMLSDIEIKVYDYLPTPNELLHEQADVIGFSAVTLNFARVVQSAMEIRPKYRGILIIGGVHISLEKNLPRCFDVGIVGEGEITLCDLIHSLQVNNKLLPEKLQHIQGLLFWYNEKLASTGERARISDLDIIPSPSRYLLDMQHYLQPNNLFGDYIGRGLTIISSRGCAYRCGFCSSSRLWGRPRYHSARYVVEEIESLVREYQIDLLYFSDDNFSSNIGRLRDLARLMVAKSINIDVGIMGRVDYFNSEVAELYQAIGVKSIAVGIESGSERVLKFLKGGNISKNAIKDNLAAMAKHGFKVSGCFMIGSPSETEDEILETIDFASNLPLSKINFYISTPFYGTEWWDIAIEQGIVPENPSFAYWSVYNLREFDINRPLFSNTVSRSRLKELCEIFEDVQKSVFHFDWRSMND